MVYARKRLIEQGDAKPVDLVKAEMDERETRNGYFTVEGMGTWMVYGQNDPIWNRLIFETANPAAEDPLAMADADPRRWLRPLSIWSARKN